MYTRRPGRGFGSRGWAVTARVLPLVFFGTLMGAGLAPAPAAAHADLVGTTPANGEHLDAAPAEVRLRFSEPVNLVVGGVVVLDSAGGHWEDAPARLDPGSAEEMVLPLPADMGDGVYTVSWRVVSADSHPIHGAFVFSVGAARADPLPQGGALTGADSTLGGVFWFFRMLSYAALAVLAGGLFFLFLCWPSGARSRPARRLLTGAWGASLVGALAALFLQGPYGAGATLRRVGDPALLSGTLGTDYGRYVLARLAALAVGGALLLAIARSRSAEPPRTLWVAAVLVVCVALPATWTGTGHAHAEPGLLPPLIDLVHLAAMSAWLGGLVMLSIGVLPASSARPLAEVARALTRFSTVAMLSVAALVATGLVQAWRGLGSLAALPDSSYGTVLVYKLAAIGLLLWFAAMSRAAVRRRYLAPPGGDGEPVVGRSRRRAARAELEGDLLARRGLRRSVGVEGVVAVVVLGITSVLVATPPGSRADTAGGVALAGTAAAFTADLPMNGGGTVRVELTPARVGSGRLAVNVLDATGNPWDVPEVTGALSLAAQGLGPLKVTLARRMPGTYASDAVTLPMAGSWFLRISVRTSEIDVVTVSTQVAVT